MFLRTVRVYTSSGNFCVNGYATRKNWLWLRHTSPSSKHAWLSSIFNEMINAINHTEAARLYFPVHPFGWFFLSSTAKFRQADWCALSFINDSMFSRISLLFSFMSYHCQYIFERMQKDCFVLCSLLLRFMAVFKSSPTAWLLSSTY